MASEMSWMNSRWLVQLFEATLDSGHEATGLETQTDAADDQAIGEMKADLSATSALA